MESQVAAVVNPTSSTSDAQPLELASNGTTQGDSDATQTQTQPATGSVAKTSVGSPDSTPVKDVSIPEKKIDAKQLGQVNFRNLKKTNEGESKGKDSPAPKATSGESSKTPAKKDEVKKSPSTPAAKDNKPDVKKQDTEKKPTAVKEDVKKEPAKAKADSPTTPAKKDAAKSGDDLPLSALVKKETPAAKTPAKSTEKSAETKTSAKSNDKPAVKTEGTNGAAKKDDDTPLLDLVAQEKSPAKSASKPATPAPKAKPTPKSTPKRKNVVLSESSESESESESGSTSESGSESESESESESDSSSSEEVKKKTPVKKTPVKKSIKVPENKKRKKQDESSSESDSESDSESEEEPPKKKAKTNSGKSVAKKETKSKPKGKKSKKNDVKWTTLEHNGVNFPPAYIAHGVKMRYDGKEVELTPLQEEFASYFAKYLETTHIEKPQFAKNFFADWLKLLNPKGTKKAHVIQKYELCDFAPILKYLKEQQEKRKSRGKEEKAAEKKEKDRLKEIYGVATVDGRKESLGNWTIEPPGLFLGRGNHPKAGMIKHRVQPEDVTLNLSKDAKVPDAPEGHKWGSIVHDNTVAWIATWKENIKGDNKYVLFAPSSSIRSNKDREKFETARRLKNCVGKIRKQIEVDLTSKDEMIRQRATAVWIIDRLALRVGNEKNKDEEADTVGCCSLRVEHIKLHPPTTVEFEFLGKDSMRYHNSVQVDEQVFKNLQAFCKSKKGDEEIFDRLTTHSINRYLSDQMEGLTAKVFRTYNASITLENELGKLDEKKLAKMTPEQKLIAFNDANRQVAILCNHQKTVAKNIGEQMQRIDDKINELKDQRKELKDQLKSVNGGSDKKGKKRKRDEVSESSDEDESPKKKAKKSDDDSPKKKKLPTDPEKIKAAIEKIEARIKATELRKQDKDANKEIALGTSKTNYIDPRIVISWCKKMNLSINKVFTKTIREKFPWAFEEVEKESEYEF